MPSGIDAVLAVPHVRSKHILLLYTSLVDKDALQASFFSSSGEDETLVYITEEEARFIMSKFDRLDLMPWVIHPHDIGSLKTMEGKLRIITDGVFRHDSLEEFLSGNKNSIALCMYNLATLPHEQIQKLADSHDRMILSTPDMTLLSAAFFDKYNIADATIERFVREYLDVVVLALIASKPMCGTDIIDSVHKNFNVLLSPGTIYPLLHRLKKEGLLQCEYGVKKKVYKPAKDSTANIRNILNEHLLANDIINGFLKSRGLMSQSLEANHECR